MTTATARKKDDSSIWRRIAIAVLVLIGALAIALGNVYAWAVRTTLTTDAWVSATAPLARDPAVQQAIGTLVIERVEQRIDVQGWVSERLPDQLDPIAAVIANTVRRAVEQAVMEFIASDGFADAWATAMREGHASILTFVRETDVDPTIPLKVDSIVDAVNQRLTALGIDLFGPEGPPSLGDVAIRVDQRFAQVQTLLGWAERLVWIVPLVALACFAVALALGKRRGRLFVTIAATTAAILLFELIGFRIAASEIAAIPVRPVYQAGVEAVLAILLAGLFAQTQALLVLAVVIAVAAWASRRISGLEPARAFIVRYGRALQLGVLGLTAAWLLFAAEITVARALLVVALAVAAIVGIEAVRRDASGELVDELPAVDTGPPPPGSAA